MWSYTSKDNQRKDINVEKDKRNTFLSQISTPKFSIVIDIKIQGKI